MLIVDYTRRHTTKPISELIDQAVISVKVILQTAQQPYPGGAYNELFGQAHDEVKTNYQPKLSTKIHNPNTSQRVSFLSF